MKSKIIQILSYSLNTYINHYPIQAKKYNTNGIIQILSYSLNTYVIIQILSYSLNTYVIIYFSLLND